MDPRILVTFCCDGKMLASRRLSVVPREGEDVWIKDTRYTVEHVAWGFGPGEDCANIRLSL